MPITNIKQYLDAMKTLCESPHLSLELKNQILKEGLAQQKEVMNSIKGSPELMKVAATSLLSIAGLVGAGAAATGAWAYPAWKAGEHLGKKIEEKKMGQPVLPTNQKKSLGELFKKK